MPKIFQLILPIFLGAIALCSYAEEQDKLLDFMPPNTELIEHRNQGSGKSVTLAVYKFQSESSRDTIVKFYRAFFKSEGFQEYEEYAAAADNRENQAPYYLFGRPGYLVVLNLLLHSGDNPEEDSEERMLVYYVTIHYLPQ
jgi:hypothetical protein